MDQSRKLIQFIFIGLFVSPFLALLLHLEWQSKLKAIEFFQYFVQSTIQATLSTLMIFILGFLFCLGLIASKNKRLWMTLGSLPAFAPTIFIVLSSQMWLGLFQLETMTGLFIVVVIHALMNMGLAGSIFHTVIEAGLSHQASLAYIEGADKKRILLELFRAKRTEISLVLLSFFALCFSSFAIPMIVGGKSGGTLELLAYLQIAQRGDLSGAFIICLVQWLAFFALVKPLSKNIGYSSQTGKVLPKQLGQTQFKYLAILAFGFCLGGMLIGLKPGFTQLGQLVHSGFELFPLWTNSLLISLTAGLISFALYMFLSYLWVDQLLHKFSIGFGTVSSVLLGLGLFALPFPVAMKLTMGLAILFFPIAYRIFGAPQLMELTGQVHVAELMGASAKKKFTDIVFPQVLPSALRLSGVVVFWSMGEYALSSVVTGELSTLGLLAKSFMLGYRLELAALLNWIILLTGGLLFLTFMWSADVCRRKYKI